MKSISGYNYAFLTKGISENGSRVLKIGKTINWNSEITSSKRKRGHHNPRWKKKLTVPHIHRPLHKKFRHITNIQITLKSCKALRCIKRLSWNRTGGYSNEVESELVVQFVGDAEAQAKTTHGTR